MIKQYNESQFHAKAKANWEIIESRTKYLNKFHLWFFAMLQNPGTSRYFNQTLRLLRNQNLSLKSAYSLLPVSIYWWLIATLFKESSFTWVPPKLAISDGTSTGIPIGPAQCILSNTSDVVNGIKLFTAIKDFSHGQPMSFGLDDQESALERKLSFHYYKAVFRTLFNNLRQFYRKGLPLDLAHELLGYNAASKLIIIMRAAYWAPNFRYVMNKYPDDWRYQLHSFVGVLRAAPNILV